MIARGVFNQTLIRVVLFDSGECVQSLLSGDASSHDVERRSVPISAFAGLIMRARSSDDMGSGSGMTRRLRESPG